MVDITSALTNAASLSSSTTSGATSAASLADNYETFLTLLTTQLQNQDPLDPMDTDQFTQQLIQYTEVEQMMQSNKNLEALVQLASANTSVGVINYVGKQTVFEGNNANLSGGQASWQVSLPEDASSVTYVVKDASGNEVYSTTGTLKSGDNTFSWDGATSTGGTADEGSYTLQVEASSSSNSNIKATVSTSGIITGVDMSGSSPKLLINGTEYDISDVREVHLAD